MKESKQAEKKRECDAKRRRRNDEEAAAVAAEFLEKSDILECSLIL